MKNISSLIQAQARQKSQSDKVLRELLCQHLDKALIDHIDFIQLEQGVLHCSVQSSAWASRIRFFSAELLGIMQNANISARQMRVSISKKNAPQELMRSHTRKPKAIPAASIDLLDTMAGTLEDSGLKTALEKLVRTAREKNQA
ncbi:MAG: DUF721 domain-containing protein [Gammaproteobacteria bacterium]|nr:DUF721 domain-containing protein [Gammaproteobacteria bacterium]